MRTLKLALATALAVFAGSANAQATRTQYVGMGDGYAGGNVSPAAGVYQQPVIAGSQPDAQAFHAGGVAACDGCHVMHNANNGVAKSTLQGSAVAPWSNVTNMFLLQGTDQSSTCLICHDGPKAAGLQFTVSDVAAAASPTNRTPGGDFGWLRQSFKNSPGDRHGHNIKAADFGLAVDGNLTIAPGGTWVGAASGKSAFACSSCHDPHGRYRVVLDGTQPNGLGFIGPYAANSLPIAASGSYGALPTATYAVGAYRLLAGQGYAPVSNAAFPFPNDPPVAVAPMTYNASEATAEVRVAYGTGMSEWCQNCHTNVHFNSGTRAVGIAGFRHPAGSDALLAANQISIYNTYISSGKMNPALTSNYTSLVPFEQGKDKTIAYLTGKTASNSIIAADGSSNVMCLSCHRAHATAFDSMVRWDQMATFLTDGTGYTNGATGSTTGGAGSARTTAQTAAGYYDRTVGVGGTSIGFYQRSLCNKCHGKD